MSRQAIISAAVAPIHKEAGFTSEMVTQGLMWESISIIDKEDDWCNIIMEDGYEGWIHNFYLTELNNIPTDSLVITNRYAPIRSQRGEDAKIVALLSFGTKVPLLDQTSGYCQVRLIDGTDGFVPAQDDIISQSRNEIIKLASSLISAPYIWGGKSSFGYDCSGLIQMVFKTAGISMPRDTKKQIKADSLEEIAKSEILPGDLVFFSRDNCINHVALLAGDGSIIHCSGEVKLESILEGASKFNSKLAQLDHTFISISNRINS